MKRTLCILILLALLLCTNAFAAGKVLTLPAGTKVIETEAFCELLNLGKVILPEGIEEIHSRAFADSTLSEINLPQSLAFIADDAFSGCEGASFTAEEGSYAYTWAVDNGYISYEVEDAVFSYLISKNTATITDCTSDAAVITVPAQINGVPVTGIAEYAFEYRNKAEKVILPATITEIGGFAFYECTSLQEIDVPAGVSELPDSAFRGCSALTKITLHKGLKSIGYMCFDGCNELVSITLPEGLTQIGISAFNECWALKEVNLPKSLTTIESRAFYDCFNIDRLVIPKAVSYIERDAFDGCSLTAVVTAGSFAQTFCAMNHISYQIR